MVWVTQLFFYGVPWLNWNGRRAAVRPGDAALLYVRAGAAAAGVVFLAALLVISALALFFFTAVAGRLWCGYACPQSVYTQIFLWMEHRFEGDRPARMGSDKAPWSREKLPERAANTWPGWPLQR
ncbi:MAG: 4Fe-4S binding protein [Burkholderiales bacterium]|nr:4Fe-4S binding protein [Burkholderiales bacterium]